MADTVLTLESDIGVLWLDEPACIDAARVGGKAAALGRLAARFPVPPGFCLPAATVDRLVAGGRSARDGILDLIRPAYERLAHHAAVPMPRVAVRSSAVDEDGAQASVAGQHETYLNLAGPEEIADAILRCWESSQSERALAYRREFGLGVDDVQLAVLVQQLVRADASAVVFSANPVSGAGDEVVVTATFGLGESLVGGTVTPDTWRVDKRSLTVTEERIGDKRRMTVATPDGTREVEVPRALRLAPSLDRAQVTELAGLARSLEEVHGWPVDVEAAYSRGRVSLLQCRPITGGVAGIVSPDAAHSGGDAGRS